MLSQFRLSKTLQLTAHQLLKDWIRCHCCFIYTVGFSQFNVGSLCLILLLVLLIYLRLILLNSAIICLIFIITPSTIRLLLLLRRLLLLRVRSRCLDNLIVNFHIILIALVVQIWIISNMLFHVSKVVQLAKNK